MTGPDRDPQIHSPHRQLFGGVLYPALILIVLGLAAAASAGAAISGWIAGTGWAWPSLRILLRWVGEHWADPIRAWSHDPRPGPTWLIYLCAGAVVVVEAIAVGAVWALWHGIHRRRLERRSGLAGISELDAHLSARAVTASAARLRPSLAGRRHPDPRAAGSFIGIHQSSDSPLFATHEDSKAVIAPVRMGKTSRQAVNDVLDAPGAVVVTTTRFDLIELTATQRAERGRVWVFDPEGRTPWLTPARWSLIDGCANYDTALRRAIAVCAARPTNDTTNGGYFAGQAEGVLAALLHAAALSGSTVDDLRLWATTKSRRPVEILDSQPDAAVGIGAELRSLLDNLNTTNDSSGTGGIYSTLALLLRPLASPTTRDAVTAQQDDQQFDIDRFVTSGRDTIYLVSKGGITSAAPVVTALVSEILHRAEVLSQFVADYTDLPDDADLRLDPPFRACLDEVGNVSPIHNLHTLMADSGGRGIAIYIYVQSFAQLRQRWGVEQATEIWDNASVRLILGGLSTPDDLADLSRLLAERPIEQASFSSGGSQGHVTVSQRYQPAMTADEIRTLSDGTALLLYRNLPAALVTLPGWWETPRQHQIRAGRHHIRQHIAAASIAGPANVDDEPQ